MHTIVVNTTIVHSLAKTCPFSFTIIFYHFTINITAAMSTLIKVVVAQPYIVAVLAQSLHLIVYLLRDTAMLGKAMIYKEEYSHS